MRHLMSENKYTFFFVLSFLSSFPTFQGILYHYYSNISHMIPFNVFNLVALYSVNTFSNTPMKSVELYFDMRHHLFFSEKY